MRLKNQPSVGTWVLLSKKGFMVLVKLNLKSLDLDFDIDFDLASFALPFCLFLSSGASFLLCTC